MSVFPQPDCPNLATMMFDLAQAWPNRVLFRYFRNGAWQCLRWDEAARMAAAAARALAGMGVCEGDRVLICSENRPEIPVAEWALLAMGAVPVFAYVTNTESDHRHLLQDSGARLAIVANAALAARVRGAGDVKLIAMDGESDARFDTLTSDCNKDFADIATAARRIPPDQLACLIYTSGTGGTPKGVMLSHRAILTNCRDAAQVMRDVKLSGETYLSFLPLSHAFEHTVGQFFMASQGVEIAYARGVESLSADLQDVQPALMVVVPRLLEAIRGRIMLAMAREPGWKQALLRETLRLGQRRQQRRLTLLEKLRDAVLDRLVRRKLRQRFGGKLQRLVSGGARLRPEVGEFFQGLDVQVMQGYGQTEAGPVISMTKPGDPDIASVGAPFPSAELRFAPDGEILVRGPLTMDGYWNNPQASETALQDGWLHTGDIGYLNAQGNLVLTDRKKDIIVLSGGENISPAKLESLLMAEKEIAQIVVYGDHTSSLAALVVPQPGQDNAIAEAIARVNKTLSVTERIRKHKIVPEFTIESGLLTPTHKVKRALAIRLHQPEHVA